MRNARLPARIADAHSESAYVSDRAIEFLKREGDAPWVLHLSYVKPHWPYIAPAPWHAMYGPEDCLPVARHEGERGAGAHPVQRAFQDEEVSRNFQRDEVIRTVRPTYQGLISQTDHHLGRVLEELDRLGLRDETLIVFTADHGDYLGDHWLGEKELFHDTVQRVPMILVDPRASADATRGASDERLVEAIDVVPTILDALGLEPQPHLLEGRSLLPLLHAAAPEWRDAVVSELDWTMRGARRRLGLPTGHHHAWMLRTERWKYVHWSSGFRPQLFDLAADPQEFCDLGAEASLASVREALRERLLAWFTGLKRRTTITWAEAELRTDSHKRAGVFYGEW
jgi:arylsulfatase A-like enzyme